MLCFLKSRSNKTSYPKLFLVRYLDAQSNRDVSNRLDIMILMEELRTEGLSPFSDFANNVSLICQILSGTSSRPDFITSTAGKSLNIFMSVFNPTNTTGSIFLSGNRYIALNKLEK